MDGLMEGRRNLQKGVLELHERATEVGKDGYIAHLHEEMPLHKDRNGIWLASKFDDVRVILLDHARFSSAAMSVGEGSIMSDASVLLADDPPRHSVLRSLLAKAFTPAAMEAMRPNIERLATKLAAAIPHGQEVDIVDKMTTPLPVAVIAKMLGVPAEREVDFRRWSNALTESLANPDDRAAIITELRGYFAEVCAERRLAPGGDLISGLTKVADTSETLSDPQVVSFCTLLMFAGNETTTNLLGNLLDRLADDPEDWTAMRNDPALIDAAIEESLRVDSPVQVIRRLAKQDVAFGDQTIKAGDMVMVYLASANRDPEKWADPANFELARIRERHVAFGHGVHICIGAPLARMEAKLAMAALLDRFKTIARGAEPPRRINGSGGVLFGFKTLPVVFG